MSYPDAVAGDDDDHGNNDSGIIDRLTDAAGLADKQRVDVETISPLQRRGDGDVDELLAGDFAGAFGGFLDRRLRASDFALGWRSAADWMPDALARHGLGRSTIETISEQLDRDEPDWFGENDLSGDGVDQLSRRGRLRLALLGAHVGRVLWSAATPSITDLLPGANRR